MKLTVHGAVRTKNVKNKAKMGSKPQNHSYIMMSGHWDPETSLNDL